MWVFHDHGWLKCSIMQGSQPRRTTYSVKSHRKMLCLSRWACSCNLWLAIEMLSDSSVRSFGRCGIRVQDTEDTPESLDTAFL